MNDPRLHEATSSPLFAQPVFAKRILDSINSGAIASYMITGQVGLADLRARLDADGLEHDCVRLPGEKFVLVFRDGLRRGFIGATMRELHARGRLAGFGDRR